MLGAAAGFREHGDDVLERLTDLSRTNLLLDNLPGWGAMAGGLLGLYCGLRGDRKAKA